MKKPIVLFIVGYGRSGSTLLDRLLGSIEDFRSCGEIFGLWRGLSQNELCSCGFLVKKCNFWRSVINRVFGDTVNEDAIQQFAKLFYATLDTKKVFSFCFPSIRSKLFQRNLNKIEDVINALYRAIMEVSGTRVIVDSSKYPLYAYFLSEANIADLRFVHLVRESRATVYSNWRKKFIPGFGYTATQNPYRTALGWNLHNFLAERLKNKYKYVQVHYEDLALHPRETVLYILEKLGLMQDLGIGKATTFSFLKKDNIVVLERGHLVAGNIMRFQQGEIEIKPDEEWRKSLPSFLKIATTFLTVPFLKKYGYSIGKINP